MDINDVRNKIDGLLAMFKNDAAFQAQVQLDPSRTLDSVGLSLNQLYDSDLEHIAGGMSCTPRTTTESCSCNC
jgi:hypothetical protein